jgi:cytochrome P450
MENDRLQDMTTTTKSKPTPTLSLYQLLDPEVLANPYPLYQRLRTEVPVYWDPYLHVWVVTRYADVITVLHHFSANRTPSPEQLAAIGLAELGPLAQVMVKQMLFMDAPDHTRLRGLASTAFTPARVEALRSHIREILDNLMEPLLDAGHMDVIADLAAPLPAIVTAEMMGVPTTDADQLKEWSADFAEVLGNFQHNPDRASRTLKCVEEMTSYYREAIQSQRVQPRDGLINALLTAEIDGDRLTEEEIIASCIVTMVGGQETTTNLIGNGVLTLLRHPDQLERLRNDLTLIQSAVEELLRYESPSQHTARICPADTELGGKMIRKGQAVIAVMGAGNRDPERFPDPDRLDLGRTDNRHLAFGWASHFCFGAPLARIEGQLVFEAIASRLSNLSLEPGPLVWRDNLGLRGLTSLPVRFEKTESPIENPAPNAYTGSGCPFHGSA